MYGVGCSLWGGIVKDFSKSNALASIIEIDLSIR